MSNVKETTKVDNKVAVRASRPLICYAAALSQKRGASVLKQQASLTVSTKIDKWLRDNPNATPDEAGFEFLWRYEIELDRLTSTEAA